MRALDNTTHAKEVGDRAGHVVQCDRASHTDEEAENDEHREVVGQRRANVEYGIEKDFFAPKSISNKLLFYETNQQEKDIEWCSYSRRHKPIYVRQCRIKGLKQQSISPADVEVLGRGSDRSHTQECRTYSGADDEHRLTERGDLGVGSPFLLDEELDGNIGGRCEGDENLQRAIDGGDEPFLPHRPPDGMRVVTLSNLLEECQRILAALVLAFDIRAWRQRLFFFSRHCLRRNGRRSTCVGHSLQ